LDELTDGQAVELGHVEAQVSGTFCGVNA
jgi:hypothetical protein